MSKDKLEKFKKYHWENLFPNDKKDNFYADSEQEFLLKSVRNFANQFSPKQGFLGFKGRKTRTRKDSIEFIAKTGLVDNEKEAEGFIDNFKDEWIDTAPMNYFRLTEFKNFNQESLYKARAGRYSYD